MLQEGHCPLPLGSEAESRRMPCLGQDALPLQDTLPKQESGRGNPAQSTTARGPKGGGGHGAQEAPPTLRSEGWTPPPWHRNRGRRMCLRRTGPAAANTGQSSGDQCIPPLSAVVNTLTHSARATHTQPFRLPVPVGRHPGLCPLVTAPSAQHGTTQHHTTQHSTAEHSTT